MERFIWPRGISSTSVCGAARGRHTVTVAAHQNCQIFHQTAKCLLNKQLPFSAHFHLLCIFVRFFVLFFQRLWPCSPIRSCSAIKGKIVIGKIIILEHSTHSFKLIYSLYPLSFLSLQSLPILPKVISSVDLFIRALAQCLARFMPQSRH